MKKLFISLLFLLIPFIASAQYYEADSVAEDPSDAELLEKFYAQVITKICGVEFGDSYNNAERILENKFGEKDYLLSDRTQIVFKNKLYAGIYWNYLGFEFQSDGNKSYFNRCILVQECKTAAEAIKKRDAIKEKMEDKYDIEKRKDEDGFLSYRGGMNPTNPFLSGFVIGIIKLENGDFCSALMYGPYNYVEEEL